jgi:hypothetical protein
VAIGASVPPVALPLLPDAPGMAAGSPCAHCTIAFLGTDVLWFRKTLQEYLMIGVFRRNCTNYGQTATMVHVLAPLSQAIEEVVSLFASVLL